MDVAPIDHAFTDMHVERRPLAFNDVVARAAAVAAQTAELQLAALIADAFRGSVAAERELTEAVDAARADGYSWAAIAAMLGVSKQTAQARYGG